MSMFRRRRRSTAAVAPLVQASACNPSHVMTSILTLYDEVMAFSPNIDTASWRSAFDNCLGKNEGPSTGCYVGNVGQRVKTASSAMIRSVQAYKGQKYNSIKKDCLQKGELFVDPEFPPNNKSLFFSRVDPDIEWKRPKELCKVPKLVVEGISCDDLNEGELGNSWFVSACSSLTQDMRLWHKVVPDARGQEWGPANEYGGIFHFNFWRYGQWIDVVIDDMLPTKNGRLVFCHSKSRNEFWSALLEKAYAKLYGDYESLKTGFTSHALVDFTGGVAERLELRKLPLTEDSTKMTFFMDLRDTAENKALIVCNISCQPDEIGQETELGLVKGHGYGLMQVLGIQVPKGLQAAVGSSKLHLVRLRNPWGAREWLGPWSDDSKEWHAIPAKDREKIGIKFEQEGEFWMAFDDFVEQFSTIDICHFVNTSVFSIQKCWTEVLQNGKWTSGPSGTPKDRDGGCDEHRSFLANPQYAFDVPVDGTTVMVSLEQDDTPEGKQIGEKLLQIGFHIMAVEQNRRYRVHIPGRKISTSEYTESRSIFQRLVMKRGRYVIIPSTKMPGKYGKFLLRVYCSHNTTSTELTEEGPKTTGCCARGPAYVTKVKVVSAAGLEKNPKPNAYTNPLVIVKCEGENVKSSSARRTEDPVWNFETIFYRKKPNEPILIEVMNQKKLIDEFMGMAEIEKLGNEETATLKLNLTGKGKKDKHVQRSGQLTVELTSSDDLTFL